MTENRRGLRKERHREAYTMTLPEPRMQIGLAARLATVDNGKSIFLRQMDSAEVTGIAIQKQHNEA